MITWEEAVLSLKNDPAQNSLVKWCYYDDPLLTAAQRFHTSEEWQTTRRLLKLTKSSRVLDVGSGRGIAAYAFAADGCSVTALEPNSSPIVGAGAIRSLSNQGNVQIDVVEEWGEALPFEDQSFDVVYGRAVFHHAGDLQKFSSELFRVLRVGGQVLLAREHVLTRAEDLGKFLNNHPLHRLYGGEAAYTLATYLKALEAAHFKVESIISPHSSMINFFPDTPERRRDALLLAFPSRIPKKLTAILLRLGAVESWAARQVDHHNDEPGRHYSFLCTRIA